MIRSAFISITKETTKDLIFRCVKNDRASCVAAIMPKKRNMIYKLSSRTPSQNKNEINKNETSPSQNKNGTQPSLHNKNEKALPPPQNKNATQPSPQNKNETVSYPPQNRNETQLLSQDKNKTASPPPQNKNETQLPPQNQNETPSPPTQNKNETASPPSQNKNEIQLPPQNQDETLNFHLRIKMKQLSLHLRIKRNHFTSPPLPSYNNTSFRKQNAIDTIGLKKMFNHEFKLSEDQNACVEDLCW
ncbi:Ig-like domain [Gigaspora margarita]|uniref:Ig-like domain n=1 Tax=Gigaspora margarita TaxID=4874 RepID=A0A8H4B116_GIGMA|nr:Ig-like domain [Gigaspora margarita]